MSFADRAIVDIKQQRMTVYRGGDTLATYLVSTARNGPGELRDSGCTPRGLHRIKIKIGENADKNTVFIARRPTGEVYSEALQQQYPERDWILTRILWLTGLEPGKNRGGLQDSLSRFIYIHGCPDSEPMGIPGSCGCIRMRNTDIVEFFDMVDAATIIEIE